MHEQTTELAVAERAAIALQSANYRKQFSDLVETSKTIIKILDPAGRAQAHTARMTLKNTRIAVSVTGKKAREDANAFAAAVIAEEKALIEMIKPEEDRLKSLQDDWDAQIEAERQAKIKAEEDRIAAIQARRDQFVTAASTAGTSAESIAKALADIEATPVDSSFEEFEPLAFCEKARAISALKDLLSSAKVREAAEARLKAEQEELQRQRAAQQAAAEAERERVAAEQKAEAARLAEEREQIEAQRLADAEKLAAERKEIDDARRELEAQKAKANAEAAQRAADEAAEKAAAEDKKSEAVATPQEPAVEAQAEPQPATKPLVLSGGLRSVGFKGPDMSRARAAVLDEITAALADMSYDDLCGVRDFINQPAARRANGE